MKWIPFVSTIIFIVCVHTYFFTKVRIAKKYDGYGKFAKFGYMNQNYIDWKSDKIPDEFISEWKSSIPRYRALLIVAIVQFLAIWGTAIVSGFWK